MEDSGATEQTEAVRAPRRESAQGYPTATATSTAPTSSGITNSGVLRLRGLPFVALEEDIRSFFGPSFELHDVFIVRRNGRSTGEAYVVLPAEHAVNAMQQLNKKYMGRRYIEIFNASAPDLAAVKALANDVRLRGYVVRLRGLPYSATASDILGFLEGVRVAGGADGVLLMHAQDGRPTGEAYVELEDEEARRDALSRHKEMMGARYIEVFVSSKVDMLQADEQIRFMQSQVALRRRWTSAVPQLGSAALLPAGTDLAALASRVHTHMMPGMYAYAAAPMGTVMAGTAVNVNDLAEAMQGFTISGQSHALAHAHTHLQVPASWSSTYTAGSIGMVQPGGAALPTYVDGSSQVLLQPGTSVQGRGRALAEQPTALVYPGQYMQYMMPAMHTGSSGATVWLPAVPQHMWGAGYAPAPGQLLPTSPYSAQGAPPASQGLT